MKKLIVLIGCLAMFAFTAMADTNVTATAPESTSLFNAKEFGLSLGTGYTVDRAAAFKAPYALNIQAGAFWFPWKHFGFDVELPFYSTKGTSLQEVEMGVVVRLPLSDHIFLLKNIAPYVGLDGVYNWQSGQDLAYIGKAGVDFRLNNKWGFFAEGQYRNSDVNWGNGQTAVVGGLKFAF